MESRSLPRRWQQILILLVTVMTFVPDRGLCGRSATSVLLQHNDHGASYKCGQCFKGEECGGLCGYGTLCIDGTYCRCQAEFYILLGAKENTSAFCLRSCESRGDVCPANTTCKRENFGSVNIAVCDCSAEAKRSATGQCLGSEANTAATTAADTTTVTATDATRGTATATVTTPRSSALSIVLAAGIGGIVLLAVIVLVALVVVRRQKGHEGQNSSSQTVVTDHLYENVTVSTPPEGNGPNYGTDIGAVKEVEVSSAGPEPGPIVDVATKDNITVYEEILGGAPTHLRKDSGRREVALDPECAATAPTHNGVMYENVDEATPARPRNESSSQEFHPRPEVRQSPRDPRSASDVLTGNGVTLYENVTEGNSTHPSNDPSVIYSFANTPDVSEVLYTTLAQTSA